MLSPSPPPASPEPGSTASQEPGSPASPEPGSAASFGPRPAPRRAAPGVRAAPGSRPRALARRLLAGRPWRAGLYLLTSVPLGVATLVALLLLAVAGSALTVLVIGVPLLLTLVLAGIPLAALERRRLRLIDPAPLLDPHREPPGPGLASWLRTRLQERCTWRELAYALLFAFVLWPLEALAVGSVLLVCGGLIGTPAMMAAGGDGEARVLKLWLADSWPEAFGVLLAGVVLLPLLTWPLGVVARGRAVLTRALLSPPHSALDSRIAELDRSRTRLVDAFEAERRRIERDLHDGAQARLVAMGMNLGTIEALIEKDPARAKKMLAMARESSAEALTELRDLVRGIHPPVLAERGLGDAVKALALRLPVASEVTVELPGRADAPVESAAYFAVSEALTNAVKHARAERVYVDLHHAEGMLRISVTDDGGGGAVVGSGSGLSGIERRLGTFDGVLAVSSPAGGPTMVTMEIPCELS